MKPIQIADEYGVSRQAVSAALQRAHLSEPRVRYDQYIPWKVRVAHQRDYEIRMLRLYARRQLGIPNEPRDDRYLDAFIEKLTGEHLVVDYDPDEGFYYTDKRDGVDEHLIRDPRLV